MDMKLRFNDSNMLYNVYSYNIFEGRLLTIIGDFPENMSGLVIYDKNGMVIKDCSTFTTKYNVHSQIDNGFILSNDGSTDSELIVNNDQKEKIMEHISPLSNEELTECVADLMYEMSLAQLGMTGGE